MSILSRPPSQAPKSNPSPRPSTPPNDTDAVGLLDELLLRASSVGGSDVHLEPREDRLRVRIRIDGVMVDQPALPTSMSVQMISRIKMLARMDIAERRMPQDG